MGCSDGGDEWGSEWSSGWTDSGLGGMTKRAVLRIGFLEIPGACCGARTRAWVAVTATMSMAVVVGCGCNGSSGQRTRVRQRGEGKGRGAQSEPIDVLSGLREGLELTNGRRRFPVPEVEDDDAALDAVAPGSNWWQ